MSQETAIPSAIRAVPWHARLGARPVLAALVSGAAVFTAMIASFVLAALRDGLPLRTPEGALSFAPSTTWPAFVLSLLAAVVIGTQVQEFCRQDRDAAALRPLLRAGATFPVPRDQDGRTKMHLATAGGLLLGLGLNFFTGTVTLGKEYPLVLGWFVLFTTLMMILLARGVMATILSARSFARTIERDLVIDIFHVERFAAIGRRSARNALSWFLTAAVVCLFFAGGVTTAATASIILVAAAMGILIFVRPMERVRRRIRADKDAELVRVRAALRQLRNLDLSAADTPARLAGLLAYEARIEAIHEWPFDQSTLMRVAAYMLIPAIPWFGEAIVSDLVQRLTH